MAGHDRRHHPLGPSPAVCGEAEPEHLVAQLRLASAEPRITELLALFSRVRGGGLPLPLFFPFRDEILHRKARARESCIYLFLSQFGCLGLAPGPPSL